MRLMTGISAVIWIWHTVCLGFQPCDLSCSDNKRVFAKENCVKQFICAAFCDAEWLNKPRHMYASTVTAPDACQEALPGFGNGRIRDNWFIQTYSASWITIKIWIAFCPAYSVWVGAAITLVNQRVIMIYARHYDSKKKWISRRLKSIIY